MNARTGGREKQKTPKKKSSAAVRLRRSRHNERGDRVYYCDYCDKFVGTSQSVRLQHNRSARHLDCFETYYSMIQCDDPGSIAEAKQRIRDSILSVPLLVRTEVPLESPAIIDGSLGFGLSNMLRPTVISPSIVVGGVAPSSNVSPIVVAPSIRVGNATVASSHLLIGVPASAPAPTISVGGKQLLPLPYSLK
jgi:hypothetical protein